MKVLFATTNPAKVKKYKAELEKRGTNYLKGHRCKIKCSWKRKKCIRKCVYKGKSILWRIKNANDRNGQ